MLAFFVAVVAALRSTTRSGLELTAEILALRHQLAVLRQRAPTRLRLARVDRFGWVLLSRVWSGWREAVQIVSPDTVVAWHRQGFALYWRWRSRPRGLGRPPISPETREVIRQMQQTNPLWGAPRVHAEVLKLGIEISQATGCELPRVVARKRQEKGEVVAGGSEVVIRAARVRRACLVFRPSSQRGGSGATRPHRLAGRGRWRAFRRRQHRRPTRPAHSR
jgi:hypothetical protein